jgi:hypothetical protein
MAGKSVSIQEPKDDTILLCVLTNDNGEEEARAYPWTDIDRESGEIYLTIFKDAFMHGTLDDFLNGFTAEIMKKCPGLEYQEKAELEYDNPMMQKARVDAKNSTTIKPHKNSGFVDPETAFIRAFKMQVFDHPEVTDYLCMEHDWEIKLVNYIKRKVIAK